MLTYTAGSAQALSAITAAAGSAFCGATIRLSPTLENPAFKVSNGILWRELDAAYGRRAQSNLNKFL